jgi:hypothetical protein
MASRSNGARQAVPIARAVAGLVMVGLHAIGTIDRTIYHGAYPEGSAIRFTRFEMCTTAAG